MKKVLIFFALCLYVLGVVGGAGYAWYYGSKPIAIGVVLVGIAAYPTAKKWWKKLCE